MSLFAELVEEGEDAEGLAQGELGSEVTLRDLEEALAELAAQNEQLELDCQGLEAHCKDLELAGWPVPCKLADVILASQTIEAEPPPPPERLAFSEHVAVVAAADSAAKAALHAKKSAPEAAMDIGKSLASAAESMEADRFHELASPVIARTVPALFLDGGDSVSLAAKAAADSSVTAGLSVESAALVGFVAAGRACQNGVTREDWHDEKSIRCRNRRGQAGLARWKGSGEFHRSWLESNSGACRSRRPGPLQLHTACAARHVRPFSGRCDSSGSAHSERDCMRRITQCWKDLRPLDALTHTPSLAATWLPRVLSSGEGGGGCGRSGQEHCQVRLTGLVRTPGCRSSWASSGEHSAPTIYEIRCFTLQVCARLYRRIPSRLRCKHLPWMRPRSQSMPAASRRGFRLSSSTKHECLQLTVSQVQLRPLRERQYIAQRTGMSWWLR